MNIRYLENSHIDRQKWDDCILNAVNGNIYAYSWYLDIVCDHWDALVDKGYNIVFPLTYRKKFGISYLYQPCFSQQLGIFSTVQLSPGIVDEFLDNIPKHFKLIEIQLNSFNEATHKGFELRMRPNLELELIQAYEDISKNYSQNLRRNLKQAREADWKIADNIDIEAIINIFKENKGRTIETLSDMDYKKLISLTRACKKRKSLLVAGAIKDGLLHAGIIFIRSHQKIILLFSATDSIGREYGAMPLLIDSLISSYSNTHTILDFEGSEDANLARFYSSFGAREFKYPFIRRDNLLGIVRFFHKLVNS